MGSRLRALRTLKNVPAKKIAETLNITIDSYYLKERGKNRFTLDEAKKISDILKMSIEEVFYSTSNI
nr:MAG TPA: helix-turn-helix domain protein [Caudoviricetes sp.]